MQIWVRADKKSTKKPFSNKKTQNQSIRGQITFGIQLQTFPSKCNTGELQSKTWNTAETKLIPRTESTTPTNTVK